MNPVASALFPPPALLVKLGHAGTPYYADPASDGGGNGTTTATTGANCAFKTIVEVNAKAFSPGDSCLFKRGATFSDNTRLNADAGVTYDAYGAGALPIINAGTANGAFAIIAVTGVTARNLDFRGGSESCVKLDGDNITFEDCFTTDGEEKGIEIYGVAATVHDVTVSRCTVTGATHSGIYSGNGGSDGGPVDIIIQDCISYSNGSVAANDHGIYCQDGARFTVRRNHCYSNYAHGIQVTHLHADANTVVERNLVYSNGDYGFNLASYSDGANVSVRYNIAYANDVNMYISINCFGDLFVYNNTLVNGTINGMYIDGSCTGNTIKNNIIFQDAAVVGNYRAYRIGTTDATANNVFDHNYIYYPGNSDSDKVANQTAPANGYTFAQWKALTGTPDANGAYADPKMANVAGNDFRLLLNSPCRGIAENVSLTADYLGNTVPAWTGKSPDIGAYEMRPTAAIFRPRPRLFN